jgi:uncharacterized protein YxjI
VSYLIKERFLGLGDDFDVTDEHGRRVLHVDGKVLSLRDRLVISDADGREVAEVTRRLVALRPTYSVTIGDRHAADVRKHLFTPFRDKYTIDVPGPDDLELSGDIFDHEYEVERAGRTVARVTRKLFRIRDTYAVDVAPGEDDLLILTAVLAVDLAQQREKEKDDD